MGFFEQSNVSDLVDSRTVEEEILSAAGDGNRQLARNICGAMLFSGDDALKKIAILSGGEKSRVMLGKVLATPKNLLFLDEPTNHLDMESCDALLEAIDDFEGTVVMVTHNEMFLHALAERLVVFQGGRTEVFEGGYQDFLEKGGWLVENLPPRSVGPKPEAGAVNQRKSRKALRRERSAVISEKSRRLAPLKKQMAQLEALIIDQEEVLAALNEEMQVSSQKGNGRQINDISRKIHTCQNTIDDLFANLETVTTEHDELQATFDLQLAALEKELGQGDATSE
jgi:ATP-binding cassette subfamily F protein 3